VSAEARRHLGDAVFKTVIPRNVRLSEAPSYGQPIALYRHDSKGAEAYRSLARELRSRDGRDDVAIAPTVVRPSAQEAARTAAPQRSDQEAMPDSPPAVVLDA
jgi:chromosome partitioning protein